ncbi:Amino acid transporter, transmembrane [Cynara cardunculus var. scolymus]|uniref:Amino acid transporter, transmembrane n=1 Tax=Cynara cardunculus var. scolymus TaxID=59895 RepID=A0A118K414_CYNCS|nr:Amino acid transporter, transmembrane [Cynara cardunculus var. scolymus]
MDTTTPSTLHIQNELNHKNLDDDGRPKRTGTWLTASAHIITAVIGSGVLSLAWAIAQLGWIAGPAVLMTFSFITYFTSTLLADAYRAPDPVTGKRNYTYMDVVQASLASISIVAVKKSNCYHERGHEADCKQSDYPYMILFAIIQILLSQIPNFHNLSWLSILAAVMSFSYSLIGLGLSIAKVAGVEVGVDVSGSEKVWRTFQAIGDIAFAYAFSTVLIEIQDTLKSYPSENKAMKRASLVGILTTTLFYVLCGCVGYAAFGNDAPGNFLTGFGFFEPFWLIDFANVCIAIHLIGAYQVFCQPIFGFVEMKCKQRWPESKFITREHVVNVPFHGEYCVNMFRLVWRTLYVMLTALIAMIFPFFNSFLGLIGAGSFYPLTVYFPIEMYIARAKIPRFSFTWVWLKILTWSCLVVSLVAAAGSVQGLVTDLKKYQPFKTE